MNWLQLPNTNTINARCETGCPTLKPCIPNNPKPQPPCNSKNHCIVYTCSKRQCGKLVCYTYYGS